MAYHPRAVAAHRAELLADLVRRASAVSADERAAWLRRECAGDAALAARVVDALPTDGSASPTPSPLLRPVESIPESMRRIGPYTLRGVLGEGSFGVVYLAEQSEPIPRRVALKVLKPTATAREVMDRFDRERRLLARLDHPSIAHVLDAGVAEDGRPWFAMEFVRGLPLLRHCDERRLPVEDRLHLVQEICRAIHHAHQNGVIHRDLKPGNILVSTGIPGDGTPRWGTPKIIDFGIAEALVGDDAASAPRAGTLEFMSPEQALGREVDTRSDLYSLGAILFTMLVGAPPLGRADGADPTEFVERLRSSEVPSPSAALAALPADAAWEVAASRSTTPSRLLRALRGDLDWITLRCLAVDPARRYDSASDLAADLERHFRRRPVEAAPNRVGYRLDRFVRRHQVPVAAALITLAVLVATTVIVAISLRSTILAHRSEHASAQAAQRAGREANDALGALLSLLTSISLDRSARGAAITADELLSQARERIIEPFKDQPRAQAMVRLALAKALLSLGHDDSASREVTAAQALLGTLGDAAAAERIEALRTQAAIDEQRGRAPEALAAIDQAAALQRQVDATDAQAWCDLLLDRARVLVSSGDASAALRAVSMAREWIARIEAPPARRRAASSAAFFEAQALLLAGRWRDALAAIQPNLDFNRATLPGHWWVAESSAVEAAALIGTGQVERGRAILAEVEAPLREALPPGATPRRTIGSLVAAAFESQGLGPEAARWRSLASR